VTEVSARTKEGLCQHNRALAQLDHAIQAISQTANLEKILSLIVEKTQELLDAPLCLVWLNDPQTPTICCRKATAPWNETLCGQRLALGEGISGRAMAQGKQVVISAPRSNECYLRETGQKLGLNLQTGLSMPMNIRGNIVGAIEVMDVEANHLDDTSLIILKPLAATAAMAIENARLHYQVKKLCPFNENIVQMMEEGIIIEDASGHITFVNRKGLDILGYTSTELIDQHWKSIVAPDCVRQVTEETAKRTQGIVSLYETSLLTSEGERVPVLVSACPLFEEEHFTGVLSVFTDISERKEMEKQMLRAERLAAMGRVLAVLAYEIRNPLQAIISHLELVLDFPLKPSQREEHLQFCRQEVERLAEITDRVLSLARTNQSSAIPTSVDHLVHRALKLAAPSLEPVDTIITVDISPDLPAVQVSPEPIVQVLLNVLLNAVEAVSDSEEGHTHITAQVKDDKALALILQNNGPPIPPESLKHIFDPFFTTKPESTGLGLFISHNIIEHQGGTITVENRRDQRGVIYTIALPIAR
jgi:PAS domain S-box-containing protein